jgi:hypothetical protein
LPLLSADIEAKILEILEGLSRAGVPVKGRTIARILADQFGHPYDKREINSFLYRMRALGRVERDDYFRWSFKKDAYETELTLDLEDFPLGDESESGLSHEPPPSATTFAEFTETQAAEESESQRIAGFIRTTCGPFTLSEEVRPYDRYCSWCADKIPAKRPSIVVRLAGKHKAKFCGEECWQNWESIYWQRAALKRLGLTKDAFRREQRVITRQKRFLGYGWAS